LRQSGNETGYDTGLADVAGLSADYDDRHDRF
jgi:hypothetical protein